ncbi:transmembrane 220 family protein [Chryseolinea sp. T2]|uniref:transmembrane 220 family protein n=1 Tax=Chryseolinea sp. T2 TaxID=3129255 RepID=UPI003077852B
MKVVNFLLAVMFLIFAFVQINDPDPLIWILIYGAMAVVCVMAIFSYYPLRFLVVLLVAYLAYSVFYFKGVMEWLRQDNKALLFDDIAKMEHWYIEEAREFLGLLICMIVVVIYIVQARKRSVA